MSEQKKGKRTSSVSTIVATAIVALAAAAALIVLIMMTKKTPADEPSIPDESFAATFEPTQEFVDECGENAQALVSANYRIVRLFVCEGLPHRDEPYGNRPEDGLYTANSDEFKTYEEIEALVKSVFTEEEANRILTHMPSDPAAESGTSAETSDDISRPEYIAVYGSRDVYVDVTDEDQDDTESKVPDVVVPSTDDGESSTSSGPAYVKKSVLGISEYFKPYTNYKKPWGSTSIKIVPVNEAECLITVYLGADKDVDLSSVEDTDILNTKMVKRGGEWRLTELIY